MPKAFLKLGKGLKFKYCFFAILFKIKLPPKLCNLGKDLLSSKKMTYGQNFGNILNKGDTISLNLRVSTDYAE